MTPETVSTPWCGPAIPDPPDPRPWWRRLPDRLRKGPYERSRITASGYVLIALTIALGGAAYNSGNNLLFLALSFLLSCLILNGLLAWANFGGLAWRMHAPRRLTAGQKGRIEIELRNHRRWLPCAAVYLELEIPHGPQKRLRLSTPRAIGPGESVRVVHELPALPRGLTTLTLHRVGSSFPFGFIRKGVVGEAVASILVRPAPIFFQARPLPASSPNGAELPSRRIGQQGELLGLRGYRPGDSPRAIHWKASARTGRLLIRELSQDQAPRLGLRLTCSRRVWTEPKVFEKMLSLAAALSQRWAGEGVLAAVALDDRSHVLRRASDLDDLLDALALAELHDRPPSDGPALRGAATAHLRPLPRQGVGAFLHEQSLALALR